MACFETIVHGLWLRNFILGLGVIDNITKMLKIYCNNFIAVFFLKNDKYSNGAKHMEVKYKEDIQKKKRVSIEHISTTLMIADPLTKRLLQRHLINMSERWALVGTVINVLCSYDFF